MSKSKIMRIGIDISLLGFNQPTGVPLIAKAITRELIKHYPQDQFVLFAFVPKGSLRAIKNLSFVSAVNVQLVTRLLPAKVFFPTATVWQSMGWPTVERFTGKLDIFHSFDWFTYQSKAMSTATIFDCSPLSHPEWHNRDNIRVFKHRMKVLSAKYQHFFPISRFSEAEFCGYFPMAQGKTTVAYPALYQEKQKSFQAQARSDMPYWLMVGTIEPRKNMVRGVKAYLSVAEHRSVPPLMVIGSPGWDEEALQLFATAKDKVKLVGYVPREHMADWYQQAAAVLYPSLYEGFGLPVLEGLAYGVPVITSQTTSIPEVGGDAVWYSDPYHQTSIEAAMITFLNTSSKERQKQIEAGKHRAATFLYQQTVSTMHAVWQKLIKKQDNYALGGI